MKAYVQIFGRDWTESQIMDAIRQVQDTRNWNFCGLTGTTTIGIEQNCLIFDRAVAPSGNLRIGAIANEDATQPGPGETVVCSGWAFVAGNPQFVAVYRS